MKRLFASALVLACASPAIGQTDRIRFWNLTANTITKFYLAPAGTDKYGPDQCVNDRDGTVDHDERLRITGVTPGRYDARQGKAGPASSRYRREGGRHLLDRGTASLELPEIAPLGGDASAPPHPSRRPGGRSALQGARGLGRMGRDGVHQGRRQGVVGLEPELLQPPSDGPHPIRAHARFDHR